MFENLLEVAIAVLLWVFDLTAKLGRRAADKNHFVFGSGQRPFGISRRHVLARKIGSLMASIATHAVDAVAVFAALHVLQVDVAVVALQR